MDSLSATHVGDLGTTSLNAGPPIASLRTEKGGARKKQMRVRR